MWARPRTSTPERQQLAHRAHVDHGGLEQRLAHAARRPARRGASSRSVSARARERVAVGVHAARGQPDHRVAGLGARRRSRPRRGPRARRTCPPGRCPLGDGWPRISSGTTASSPPGISTPASSAPAFRPRPIAASTSSSDLLDGDVVEHRDRVGARRRSRRSRSSRCSRCPTVSKRPSCSATISLVPTPSVDRARPVSLAEAQDVGVVARAQHASAARGRCRSCAARPPARRRPRPASPVSTPARAYAESPIAAIQPQAVVDATDCSAAAHGQRDGVVGQRRPPTRAPRSCTSCTQLLRAACRPRRRRRRPRRSRSSAEHLALAARLDQPVGEAPCSRSPGPSVELDVLVRGRVVDPQRQARARAARRAALGAQEQRRARCPALA